jgi:hypothetical protein
MANALAELIRAQGLASRIQGREYVQVEGWTTLATMLGVTAREVATVETDGVFTATVELVRMSDGAVISRASAECGSPDELDRRGKPLWANRPRYARRSMAQTRATGKACRLAFSWIMRLAGYEPTPAEEMPDDPANGAQRSASRAGTPSPAPSGAPQPARQTEAPITEPHISEAQHRRLEARLHALGLDRERVKRWCQRAFGCAHFPDLTPAQYQRLDERLEAFAERAATEADQRAEEWAADEHARMAMDDA